MNGDLMYKYIYNEGRKYGIQGSVVCNGGKDLADNSDSIDWLFGGNVWFCTWFKQY